MTYDDWLQHFYDNNWDKARAYSAGLFTKIQFGWQYHNINNDHEAQTFILQALDLIESGWDSLFDVYTYEYPRYNIIKLFSLIGDRFEDLEAAEPSEFTMDTLINTMLVADPDQVKYFVGLVDAYRQSVWNKPFNASFYAALARGFEIWP